MEMIKITLVKSLIGVLPAHKKTAAALGLKKIGDSKVLPASDGVKGQIKAVSYLVKVETVK